MIREIELLKYLPPFVREYREIKDIMKTSEKEIQILADETEIILNNQFIETCNEQGIARFEKLIGITPDQYDSLDSRISRVLTRWNDVVPYTFKVFCQKLDILCGEKNYEVSQNINKYTMDLVTHLEHPGQAEELDYILDYMIPANILVTTRNKMFLNIQDNKQKIASGIILTNIIEITDNFNEVFNINGNERIANGVVDTVMINITDNFTENFEIKSESNVASNITFTEII